MNKKKKLQIIFLWLLFAAAVAAIILITLYYGLREKTEWTADTFGTTTNKYLQIKEDNEYKVSFQIGQDHFQGIRFRMRAAIQNFGKESLKFVLVDQQTDSVVDSYTLYLCETVNQAEIFVPLYYADSEGKTVDLKIYGQNINEIPSLCVSKNADHGSELYINDQLQGESYLVFSANYKAVHKSNYQILLRGILYVLVLLLIVLLPFLLKKGDETRKRIPTNSDVGWIHKYLVAYKRWILLIFLSLLYIVLAVFFYEACIEDYVEKRKNNIIVDEDPEYERELHITSDTDRIEQTFYSTRKALSTISFLMEKKRSDSRARLHVQVFDAGGNVCYHDGYVSVDSIPETRDYFEIFLDKEYKESRLKNIQVLLTAVNFGDAEVVLYTGKPNTGITVYRGATQIGTAPVLKATYANYDYLAVLYKRYAFLLYVFLLMCWFLLAFLHLSAEKVFVPIALFLGIMYMLIIPVYSVPDEYSHIDTAYIISNRLMGIEAPDEYWGYDYKRQDDVETEEYLTYNATLADYRRLYAELFKPVEDETLVMVSYKNVMSNAGLFFYLPAAIGLTIGRLLGFGTLTLFLFGRFINLLVYVLSCSYGIRKLPGLKWLYLLYATTPIALQEAASFSYDAIINATALLFVALCFSYAIQDKHNWVDNVLLVFTFFQLASTKGGVYLPICLLIFIIPIEREWKVSRRLSFYISTLILAMSAFLQNNIVRLIGGFLNPGGVQTNPFTGNELYTMSYLKQHPFKAVSLFVQTAFEHGSRIVYEFFGGKMGSLYNIQMPWMYIILFIALFLVVCRSDVKGQLLNKKRSMAGTVLIAIASVGLVCLSMLLGDTATKYNHITGIQGRYFIPCMFVLFATASSIFLRIAGGNAVKKEKLEYSALWYYVVHVVFMLNIVLVITANLPV